MFEILGHETFPETQVLQNRQLNIPVVTFITCVDCCINILTHVNTTPLKMLFLLPFEYFVTAVLKMALLC